MGKLEKRKERGTKGIKENAPIITPITGDDDAPVDPWNQPGPATESFDYVSTKQNKVNKDKKDKTDETQSTKTKAEKAQHSMPTKLEYDDDSAVHEKMKGKAGATDTKETKKEKTTSERKKLGAIGKLGKSGTKLKGTKGKVQTAKPKLRSVEENGPNMEDDTPSDVLHPIGDDVRDDDLPVDPLDADKGPSHRQRW